MGSVSCPTPPSTKRIREPSPPFQQDEDSYKLCDRASALDSTLERLTELDENTLRAVLAELVTSDKHNLRQVVDILDAKEEDEGRTTKKGKGTVKRRMFRCRYCSEKYREGASEEELACPIRYHPKKLTPDWKGHDFWKDYEEERDGWAMDPAQIQRIPAAYVYKCCGFDGTAPGCATDQHRPDF